MTRDRAITVVEENAKLLLRSINYYDEELSKEPKWKNDRLGRINAMLLNTRNITDTLNRLIDLENE